MSEINNALSIAASGIRAQTARMKIIAENIANANSTSTFAGGNPYQRQIPTFGQVLDRETGIKHVKMTKAALDNSEFKLKYDPTHPGADQNGMVKMPNVNSLLEAMDMREAQRAYEANLNIIESARSMMVKTIDLLKR